MVSLDELRSIVLPLPETSEGTHFRRPVYRVADKPFIAVEKDQLYVTVLDGQCSCNCIYD